MPEHVKWNGRILTQIEGTMHRRLTRCALLVQGHAKRLLSVSGTGTRGAGGVVTRAVKSGKKRVYGAFPSRPGEPPHKQTGRLRASVTYDFKTPLIARVGTNVRYGKYLELGMRRMAPRPWLHRALNEMQSRINSILKAPIA